MQSTQEVTKRQIIDYGSYFEYIKYEKGWSRLQQLKAQDTKEGLKLSGFAPVRVKKEKGMNAYAMACQIFGNDIVKIKDGEERYRQSIQRSRKIFREILKANLFEGKSSFLSLTYKENIQNRNKALKDLKNFRLKLKRQKFNIEYLGIMERQERGAWHFHLILFNHSIKLTHKILQSAWGNVKEYSANVKYIRKKANEDIDKMANYLTKYLGKEAVMTNKKAYFTTSGINRPIRVNDSAEVTKIMEEYRGAQPYEKYSRPNKYLGQTYFSKYHKQNQVVLQSD